MRLRPDNPMNKALLSLLIFEVIAFWLALPGMLLVDSRGVAVSVIATTAASLLALASAVTLKRPIGYPLGWATQVAGIALGFLTSMMFVLGLIFAVIWVVSFVFGRRLEEATPA